MQAAVSKSEGTATFFVGNAPGDNSNSLVKNRPESELSGYEVKLVTIDSVVSEYGIKPGLIKIDAEGAELDVLLGGEKTFREYKPVLILGLHPRFVKQKGDSFEAIWNLLEAMGYEVRINETQLSKQEFCSRGSLPDMFDVHCFHK